MRARNALRLLLMVLAGTLVFPLVVGVLALRGPATVSRAADGDPAVIATVAVDSSPGGVAVNPNTNRIYVANYGSNNVSIIDGASNTVVAAVALAVGNYPWAVAINPNTNLIYVANGGYTSNNVSVIDGASDTIVATVAGGSWPDGVAVNANTNRIYVANSADDTISVIEDIVPATPTDTFTPTPHPATPTPPHPPSVGGKVMLPPAAIAAESPGSAEDSWWSAGAYAALAVGLGAAAAAVGATAWYAKRRWQR